MKTDAREELRESNWNTLRDDSVLYDATKRRIIRKIS
jgi:hypothetical protein